MVRKSVDCRGNGHWPKYSFNRHNMAGMHMMMDAIVFFVIFQFKMYCICIPTSFKIISSVAMCIITSMQIKVESKHVMLNDRFIVLSNYGETTKLSDMTHVAW